jgi:hypothetical protein
LLAERDNRRRVIIFVCAIGRAGSAFADVPLARWTAALLLSGHENRLFAGVAVRDIVFFVALMADVKVECVFDFD